MDVTPLWSEYFGDPFILLHDENYYAYGTSAGGGTFLEGNGKAVPVLRSKDLKKWEYAGGALTPLKRDETTAYWAPEVVHVDGRFLMFYSAGGPEGEGHQIRLGVSKRPDGGFEDTGRIIVAGEDFSIDAHPFHDPKEGGWYLFYAKDFLDDPVGTGVVVAPLESSVLRMSGKSRTVVRATEEWQLFARNRNWYGKTWEKWFTVEGPAVLDHEGRYYCFYSGGNWRQENYGIGYVIADTPLGPYKPGPQKLIESRGRLKGPGHCSFLRVEGENTPRIVFHAWDENWGKRQMYIAALSWSEGVPRVEV